MSNHISLSIHINQENHKKDADSKAAVEEKILKLSENWLKWKRTPIKDRAKFLLEVAHLLTHRKMDLALLMAHEMGKPIKEGLAEIEKCAKVCTYYATHAETFLSPQPIDSDGAKSYVTYNAKGVILTIMPWNFPFWQVFRQAAPNIMAGNCVVLKHASNVWACAAAIEQIFIDAAFPFSVFEVLYVSAEGVEAVIANPLIKGVSLTGSTEAGRAVAQTAGKYLKKTVLELGGSDPYLILDDLNLGEVAEICAQSRLINNGQSCVAAKRFIVLKDFEERFIALLKMAFQKRVVGDPLDIDTDLGPMSRQDLRDELHKQVQKSIKLGAECVMGGVLALDAADHAYYPPTILRNVKPGMPAYEEELFGPVAAVMVAEDIMDAVIMANDTSFGLGAAVFSENEELAEDIAANILRAGVCFVNTAVRSDVAMPFGGINDSGYGRELGKEGILEFVNVKTVYVK